MFNQKKAAYNLALVDARKSLATAAALRESIVAEEPATKGSSVTSLNEALALSFKARTFEGYPGDLDKAENPFRTARRTNGGRRPR